MKLQNTYLPANHQSIDDIPLEREDMPCEKHRIAFPSNNKRLYPELTNIPVYQCEICGWYCFDGRKK